MDIYTVMFKGEYNRMGLEKYAKYPVNYLVQFRHETYSLLDEFKNSKILVDSGAYFFNFYDNVNDSEKTKEYLEKYYEFIENTSDDDRIQGYFDMDLVYLGLPNIKHIRRKLFTLTDKIIPVYHTIWGLNEFKRMCKMYRYIALGCSKNIEIPFNEYMPFVRYAHKHGCKVHGLGLNDNRILDKVPFDSADSSLWLQKGYWDYYSSNIEKNKENNKTYRPLFEEKALLDQYKRQLYYADLWKNYTYLEENKKRKKNI